MLNLRRCGAPLLTIAATASLLFTFSCAKDTSKDPGSSTTNTTAAGGVALGTESTGSTANRRNPPQGTPAAAPAGPEGCASCPTPTPMGPGHMGPGTMGPNHAMGPGAEHDASMPMPDGGHMR
jgi:hypothetical protein